MIFNKKFMKHAVKRVDQLKQETINKSKEVPNSEEIVQKRVSLFVNTKIHKNLS